MKKIQITLYTASSDCPSCGFSLAKCVDIYSKDEIKIKKETLGNPTCTSMESAYLKDGLKRIFDQLGIDMPYTKHTISAFELVGENDLEELLTNGKIGYRTYIRYLNPKWLVSKDSTLEETAKNFMKENGYDLEIIYEESPDDDYID